MHRSVCTGRLAQGRCKAQFTGVRPVQSGGGRETNTNRSFQPGAPAPRAKPEHRASNEWDKGGVGGDFPSTCPSVGPAARYRGGFQVPGLGVVSQVPYLRSPGGPAAPRGTAGRAIRPSLRRSTPGKARSSGCTGLLGLPGPRRGAPRQGCSGRAPTIASGARAPPLRPARPAGGKQQALPPSRLSGNFLHLDREEGLVQRSQSRGVWEEAAPSVGPPLRDALPGLCTERRLRGTGRCPSPAALSRLSSEFSGAGAGHSAAIAQSPGKDDPATVRPKATTRLGFSNELGSRPHGKSEFRSQVLPRLALLVSSTPQPGISGLSFLAFRFCVLVDTATAGPSGGPALETAQRETSCSKQGCSDRRGFFTVDLGGGRPSAQGLSAFVSLDIREG